MVDGRGRRTRRRASGSRCSSATTPGPATRAGTIAHTYSGAPVETRLDGRPTGEYGLNALALGAWGVPVGLVAGDDALAEEVADWLPWAERVVVKTAVGGHAAASLHPTVAADLVRAGAERAVRRAAAGELRAPARRAAGRHRGRLPARRRGRLRRDRAGRGAGRRPRRALRRRRSDRRVSRLPGRDPAGRLGRPVMAAMARAAFAARWATRSRHTARHDRGLGAARHAHGAGRGARRGVGARARASTTVGQERAILRLFGVSGLDAAGRPLAGADVDRWLAGDPRRPRGGHRPAVRDGPARVRPRAAAARARRRLGRRSTSRSRRSCSASPTGAPSPRSRPAAWPPPPSSGSTRSGPCVARRIDILGEAPRPWLGRHAPRAGCRRRASRRPPTSSAPASTSSGSRSRSVASWPTGCIDAGLGRPVLAAARRRATRRPRPTCPRPRRPAASAP